MKIRRFFGKDMREALKQVKDELGGDAVIMSNKKVSGGVELVAAVDPAPVPSAASAQSQDEQVNVKPAKRAPTLSEVIGDDIPDSLQALLEKQQSNISKQQTHQQSAYSSQHKQNAQAKVDARSDDSMVRSPAFSQSNDNDLSIENSQAASLTPPPSVLEPDQMDTIRAELESIKNVLKFQVSELADERKKRHNPTHHYLHEQFAFKSFTCWWQRHFKSIGCGCFSGANRHR
jgi:flagellar biosynthesis protein FlhF